MNIKIGGKTVELGYTFNSFKYMGSFNVAEFESIEDYPFKLAEIVTTLTLGAVNNSPKQKFTEEKRC